MKEPVQLLEAWFKKNQRPLPWRQTPDPYKIWISEVMLQQTQVATVVPYFLRFISTFPDLPSLAHAKETELLSLWSGLGYYSRARNLHLGAQYLLKHFNGDFPKTTEELRQIPGIGPYTAGAILSIAFNLPVPIVDGNVYRVFSRFFGYKHCIDTPKNQQFFWEKADCWVKAAQNPRDLNQALMELGATVCTKASPLCSRCPLSKACVANRYSTQERFPVRKKRKKMVEIHWEFSLYERKGRIFLTQHGKGEWWENLWSLPIDKHASSGEFLCKKNHTVTHHRIQAETYFHAEKQPSPRLKGQWFTREEALKAPISSLTRKILSELR